ncbi:MAG: hypothetical protein HN995_10015 [Candidatus Marinimicrobia bacterium]|jgi:hypothetical protein|nr:hypothetical protein [Candidatus Neomarinimicrobiota bacterium]MBT3577030.1 hypothetical protein [Candidatus Neomarinimicrobiota bacterium]MBT3679912.1 hypothetical protein [Candidatus Neomarinimicrobiota bacterium]MBT3949693.1 hypothetical protein [Candidatus Neomarinimicrobiota bacterium]MBT4253156.1 hypothetical protein [Candidatus Neomarinimicrobiota bacterium]
MSHLTKLLSLMMLTLSLAGQDLNRSWQAYMSTNASISELEARRAVYSREQIEIKSEVDRLQESSEWYNAWINKYLLSGHSNRQLVILDSLRLFDRELERLYALQKNEIVDLKSAYENVLEDYETKGVVPAGQGLRTMQNFRFGRRVISYNPILFPDYKELLNLQLNNPKHRKLILTDVQSLLQVKIIELDSIRNVREEEEELALRLASFHDDLGLQMEADPDAQQRDASGNTDKLLGWVTTAPSSEFSTNDAIEDARQGMSGGLSQEAIDLINVNSHQEETRDMSLDQRSGKDLDYLKKKIIEYQSLLDKINQELDQ